MTEENVVDVCIVEDDAVERALLRRRFLKLGYSMVEACDGQSGLEVIREQQPRVVVCDVMMPRLSGIDVCEAVRADRTIAGTYIVLITACDSQKRKRDALNAGADDYLMKPYDAIELEAKVRNGLRISQLQERLRQAANTDGLTGLWNHGQFRENLSAEYARHRRYGGNLSVVMIDIDHFKAVNDTYGHEIGNVILKGISRLLKSTVRDTDIVARYGGEEFCIICPQTGIEEAANLANRIRVALPDTVRVSQHPELVVKASFGVACTSDSRVMSQQDIITQADQALYFAKTNGRNQVRCCNEVTESNETEHVQIKEVDRLRKQIVMLSMQTKEMCLQSVWALVQALEARDPFTAAHSRNVTYYVQSLVQAAGWPQNLRAATANAAMLHDLGKIGIPDKILQKPTALTSDEAAVLRQVPTMTCKILEPLRIFETETLIIRHLRERYDGTGYPDGLSGENIPIGSRMLCIAEAFDAMTSNRAYRESCTIDEAVEKLQRCAGTHFDPEFVELFVDVVNDERESWQDRVNQACQPGSFQGFQYNIIGR